MANETCCGFVEICLGWLLLQVDGCAQDGRPFESELQKECVVFCASSVYKRARRPAVPRRYNVSRGWWNYVCVHVCVCGCVSHMVQLDK